MQRGRDWGQGVQQTTNARTMRVENVIRAVDSLHHLGRQGKDSTVVGGTGTVVMAFESIRPMRLRLGIS
jgi:hypothetical protein